MKLLETQTTVALDRVPACVLVADDAGYYMAANDRACSLTGYSREELLQRSVEDLTAPDESAISDRLWDSFLRTEKQYGVFDLRRKDGSVLKVEYLAYANLVPGNHISFITALEDQAKTSYPCAPLMMRR